VISAATFDDGIATVTSDASLCCIFVDWTSGGNDDESHSQAFALLQTIRRRNKSVPVLLMAEHSCVDTLTLDSMRLVNEFVWMHEDTAEFIAARARSLIQRYYQQLLPPFTRALFNYTLENPEYSWAAPGHRAAWRLPNRRSGVNFSISSARIYSAPIPVSNAPPWGHCSTTAGRSKPQKPTLPKCLGRTKAIQY